MGSQGYNSLPSYYVKSSDPVTPKYGFSLKGMDPILAENWVLADAAIGSGGSTVEINGVTVSDPNFNNTTPAAPMGDVNVTWQVDVSGNVSAYVSLSGGTVTSVAMTGDGTIFNATVTGSPITTSGTLIPVLLTQTANMFLAGPATGSAASPTFRALTVADLPSGYNLWNNNGNANGNLTIANCNFTTTFNQTSGVAWTWANTTVGTSSSVNSSPVLQLEANYYSGSLSEPDTWSIGTSLGVGVNGSSLLGILHSGTSGLSGVLIGNSQFTTSVENSPYLVLGGSYEVSASLNTFAEDNWYFQNVIGSGANGTSTLTVSHAGTEGTANVTFQNINDLIVFNSALATASSTNSSPAFVCEANYWTGSASAADTWTIGSSLAAGTNAVPTLSITHAGSTGVAVIKAPATVGVYSWAGGTGGVGPGGSGNTNQVGIVVGGSEVVRFQPAMTGNIDITIGGGLGAAGKITLANATGTITKYNNIATVSNGVPSEIATVDLTGQVAAIAATTLYNPTATGMFRISAYLKITTPGTSPVLGPVTITFTDGTDSVAQSQIMMLATQAGASATSNAGNTTTSILSGDAIIYALTGVAIQYAVALTGTVGTGAYEVHLKCEAM